MDRYYFRRQWDESRGDQQDSWGRSTFWFETDDDLVPLRQIEVYEAGQRLTYDADHVEDEFGFLTTVTLDDWGPDRDSYAVSPAQFEAEWAKGRRELTPS